MSNVTPINANSETIQEPVLELDWRKQLMARYAKGGEIEEILKNPYNAKLALQLCPQIDVKFRHNVFSQVYEMSVEGGPWKPLEPDDLMLFGDTLANECQMSPEDGGHRILFSREALYQGATILAKENPCDPLLEYYQQLVWDKKPRLENALCSVFGLTPTEYLKLVSRVLFCGLAARQFEPGAKMDNVVIIEGPESIRKSTFVSMILPEPSWYASDLSDMSKKEAKHELLGKAVVELAELTSMLKTNPENVKAFITSTSDHFRPPYGRSPQTFLRRSVLIGTTNPNKTGRYLQQVPGNRRFLPVAVTKIDLEWWLENRDQIHAEAAALVQPLLKLDTRLDAHPGAWWVTEEKFLAVTKPVIETRERADPLEADIRNLVHHEKDGSPREQVLEYTAPGEILEYLGKENNDYERKRVGRILAKLGYVRDEEAVVSVRDPILLKSFNRRQRWYFRLDNSIADQVL